MLGINKEDIEFLKELQHEMLTQDHICQAAPRFWVVQGTVREYGRHSDYNCDGSTLINTCDEWHEIGDTMEEVFEYISKEWEYCDDFTFELTEDGNIIAIRIEDAEETWDMSDLEDVESFIEEISGYNDIEVCYYENVDKIYENTMFLTNRECKEHIRRNYYHYPKDAHSYAMTAWRAPEVSKLFDILDKINWSEIEALLS